MALRNIWFIAFFINFYQSYRLKKARKRYQSDIVLFAKECLGQAIVNPRARSDIDNPKNTDHLILTLDGSIGRTDAAIIFLWRLICFPNSKNYILSKYHAKLRILLWREINSNMRILKENKYEYLIKDIRMAGTEIHQKNAGCSGFVRVRPARPDQLYGIGDDCFVWLDDSPGMSKDVIDSAFSNLGLPGQLNRLILNRGSLT